MIKNTVIIILLLLVLYLYYQNRKSKYPTYKFADFWKWLEEDEERKLGKDDWDETAESFLLQPSYAPPLYFQKQAESISTCPSNEEMESRTHKALWNWIQALKGNSWENTPEKNTSSSGSSDNK